jgi:hypothetical protein
MGTVPDLRKEKAMSYKWKGALWRLARVLGYGIALYVIQVLLENQAGLDIPAVYLPIVTAVLNAADKWIRERKAELG